jgi:hypothetical protein
LPGPSPRMTPRQAHLVTKVSATGESSRSPVRKTLLVRPDWLPESVWPFQTFGLEMDHSTIAVTDVGQGPTLLFVHSGVWFFIWRDVIARLSRDFRCVCFDAPGTGQSSRLPGKAISLERSARAVSTVIQSLNLQNFTLEGRVFPAVGNHETWGDTDVEGLLTVFPYLKKFGVSDKKLIYTFDSDGVRFIFLWTGDCDQKEPSAWNATQPVYEEQMKQLRAWLDDATARSIKKVFIAFHAPAFARCGLGPIPRSTESS